MLCDFEIPSLLIIPYSFLCPSRRAASHMYAYWLPLDPPETIGADKKTGGAQDK